MKTIRCALWLCVFCLLFPGCKSTQASQTDAPLPTGQTQPTTTAPTVPSGDISLHNPGKLRIPYTTKRSGVRYITDASQLPDNAVFDKYDDAFFQNKALLLVTETVSSGSMQITIDSVSVNGSSAAVHLSRSMPGDVGTADMATWLLWVEVDAGLDLDWHVANPSYPNIQDVQTH